MLIWVTGHCNWEAVSRNRYGVEKTVDTHTIMINAIKFYVCLQEILCYEKNPAELQLLKKCGCDRLQ